MFENLVVALDGSACAGRALDVAVALSKREGSNLRICSVVNPSLVYENVAAATLGDEALAELRTHAERVIAAGIARAKSAGVVAEGDVLFGEPAYETIAYAGERGANAIVVGTHGRSGLKRLFMGSVAEGILRSSSVPVIVVREETQIPALEPTAGKAG